jgi:Tol biopolymer transport system component
MKKIVLIMVVLALSIVVGRVKADFIFGEPNIVPNVNSEFSDGAPQISRDGLELYFSTKRDGGVYKIWVSKRATLKDLWSIPTKVEPIVNYAYPQNFPSLSADGLELYFADGELETINPDGYGRSDIWVMARSSKDEPWNEPINLGPVINTENAENTPCISADGLELYFAQNVPNHPKNSEILVSTRLSKNDS